MLEDNSLLQLECYKNMSKIVNFKNPFAKPAIALEPAWATEELIPAFGNIWPNCKYSQKFEPPAAIRSSSSVKKLQMRAEIRQDIGPFLLPGDAIDAPIFWPQNDNIHHDTDC